MATLGLLRVHESGRSNIQIGGNDNLFDFTYVENVAHAHLLAARALLLTYDAKTAPLDHEKVDGEPFFITNDTLVYFWDFARTVWRAAGSDLKRDQMRVIPRELGWMLRLFSEVFFGIIRKPATFNRQRITHSCMTRYYDISKAKKEGSATGSRCRWMRASSGQSSRFSEHEDEWKKT